MISGYTVSFLKNKQRSSNFLKVTVIDKPMQNRRQNKSTIIAGLIYLLIILNISRAKGMFEKLLFRVDISFICVNTLDNLGGRLFSNHRKVILATSCLNRYYDFNIFNSDENGATRSKRLPPLNILIALF